MTDAVGARIHLYTVSWNEEAMLEFFFRHYDPLVDRYIVYDDRSTDRTLEMLSQHPRVEIRKFERVAPDSFVKSHAVWQNNIWKESRGSADWIILTAIDEYLYHPDLARYLSGARDAGVTAIPALGYQMVSRDFPAPDENLALTRTRGSPDMTYSKLSLFNPDAILQTNYTLGRHFAVPTGRVKYPERDELLILHYKYLGIEHVAQRNALLLTGFGKADHEGNVGFQYKWSKEKLLETFDFLESKSIDIRDPNAHSPEWHFWPRWWRKT